MAEEDQKIAMTLKNVVQNVNKADDADNRRSEKNQNKVSERTIETLPDIELGCIFNYLCWKDKLSLLEAFPKVSRIVNSSLGWKTFSAGERRCAESLEKELECIWRFGHLFQHCNLWLGRPCRSSWECTCLFDNLNSESVFPLLEAVVDHCCSMKSLRLYHPSHVTPQSCDTKVFKQYQHCIGKLFDLAGKTRRFCLELCGLQYSHDHVRPISLRFLDYYITNSKILQLVRMLEVTRVTDSRLESLTPLSFLSSMSSLSVLKVPVHCITMEAVQILVQKQLKDLYLLNDDCTVDHEFREIDHFSWGSLLVPGPKRFAVHYVFKQRVLKVSDFVPNPFVKTVCFDSLCSPLTDELVTAVADHYGATLQLFCLTHFVWKPEIRFSDLSIFAGKCRFLTHFVSTLVVPGAVLVSLAANCPSIKEVLVVGQNNEKLAGATSLMSHLLQHDWKLHTSPSTIQVDICEISFLMDEFTLRGSG